MLIIIYKRKAKNQFISIIIKRKTCKEPIRNSERLGTQDSRTRRHRRETRSQKWKESGVNASPVAIVRKDKRI
jgi:hypothetical protein